MQSPGRMRAFILPGCLENTVLGLDILNSWGGMEKGCLCAPEGIKPGMEPLWIPPPWSSERGRGETENATSWGRFHATSLNCLSPVWQTTNSITMLEQQNFSAPSPGTLKIHQKCCWPVLGILSRFACNNKTCRISFLLLLIFAGILFLKKFFSLPCTQSWNRSTVPALPLCDLGPEVRAEALSRQCPAQRGFHRHLANGSMESNLKTTGDSEKKPYSFVMQPWRAFTMSFLVFWFQVNIEKGLHITKE